MDGDFVTADLGACGIIGPSNKEETAMEIILKESLRELMEENGYTDIVLDPTSFDT